MFCFKRPNEEKIFYQKYVNIIYCYRDKEGGVLSNKDRGGGVTNPHISIDKIMKIDLDLETGSRYNATSYHHWYKHYRGRKKV